MPSCRRTPPRFSTSPCLKADIQTLPLDVLTGGLAGSAEFDLAFTVRTGNRWGLAVATSGRALLGALDEALAAVKAEGRLRQAWRDRLPALEYPFTTTFTTE
jgi:hypothetical protein